MSSPVSSRPCHGKIAKSAEQRLTRTQLREATSQQRHTVEEAGRIFSSVKSSPSGQGFHHLGDDGVLRSYDSKGEVFDYNRLSPDEIEILVASSTVLLPADSARMVAEVMDGVDGRDVTDLEQILHPPPQLRPPVSEPRRQMPSPEDPSSPEQSSGAEFPDAQGGGVNTR